MAATTAYISLARKYRPQTINQLIGQDALVQTLRNSFELNRIASAFILTGTRGVGKTTTARIIAKALNCIGPTGQSDITLNPCGVCEPCISISKDKFIDVIEIDAASKTGVDDIREIIENSHYKPSVARYKVFIIDEVHMLSKSAFNALLKTLEEPPEHTKFIFATTEIRKVPITILSRCQRFDLRKINTPLLQQHLHNICSSEQIPCEDAALFLLAKAGNGSVRDALSLLDQAIVYCNKNITTNHIEKMLGQADKGKLYELYLAIVKNESSVAYSLLNEIIATGTIIETLIEDLINITHYVSVYLTLKGNHNLELSDSETTAVSQIAQATNLATVISLWQVLLQGYQEIKEANDQLAYTNMVLLKLLFINQIEDLDTFINNKIASSNISPSPKETNQVNFSQTNISSTLNTHHTSLYSKLINKPLLAEKTNYKENSQEIASANTTSTSGTENLADTINTLHASPLTKKLTTPPELLTNAINTSTSIDISYSNINEKIADNIQVTDTPNSLSLSSSSINTAVNNPSFENTASLVTDSNNNMLNEVLEQYPPQALRQKTVENPIKNTSTFTQSQLSLEEKLLATFPHIKKV